MRGIADECREEVFDCRPAVEHALSYDPPMGGTVKRPSWPGRARSRAKASFLAGIRKLVLNKSRRVVAVALDSMRVRQSQSL